MPEQPMRRRQFLVAGGAAVLAGCAAPLAGPSHPAGPRTPSPVPSVPPAPSGPPSPDPAPSGLPKLAPGVGRNSSGDVLHGPRTGHSVALTFHGAGTAAVTARILAELASASARVTVFAVGSWLASDPSLARAVLDGGHELGNHTYHHLPMRTLRPGQAVSEIARAASVLTRLVGNHGAWFRPSGTPSSTATIRAAATQCGYPVCVSYDIDSLDWTDPGGTAVADRVLRLTQPGSIVSLHLGHAGTADALPQILSGLAGRGLRSVPVTDLVAA